MAILQFDDTRFLQAGLAVCGRPQLRLAPKPGLAVVVGKVADRHARMRCRTARGVAARSGYNQSAALQLDNAVVINHEVASIRNAEGGITPSLALVGGVTQV